MVWVAAGYDPKQKTFRRREKKKSCSLEEFFRLHDPLGRKLLLIQGAGDYPFAATA